MGGEWKSRLRNFWQQFYQRILLSLNVVLVLLLLSSYLAAYVPPDRFHGFALLALGYPFLLLANFLFIFIWLLLKKRAVYLSLAAWVIGLGYFSSVFGIHFSKEIPSKAISIGSYNVQYFGATVAKDPAERQQRLSETLVALGKLQSHIFCGQEFSGRSAADNEAAAAFLREQGLVHQYKGGGSSLIIASRFPILEKGAIPFPNTHNGAVFADVQLPKRVIRVYNMHLQSIRLGADSEEVLKVENIQNIDKQDTQSKYWRIENKLQAAFMLRAEQARILAQHIAESPHPSILCGDMNDVPNSYAHASLNEVLDDSFERRHFGLGSTYAGNLPFLRIDYIFVPEAMQVYQHEVLHEGPSDHYPLRAMLAF